jgi:cobalt-zinc-cadmium efflux system protein
MHSHADHSHHGHNHDHAGFDSVNLTFIIAVTANLGFTILEAVYGFLTNSVSLLADAGHNLSDVLGLLLAWGASVLATRASNNAYSYGYRKSTILAAVINAVILVFAAGYIAYESVERLIAPSAISEIAVMVVAGIGILVNAGTAVLFMKDAKDDLNVRGAFLHLAYDAAISAGVVVGAAIILLTGWAWIDPILGLLIVVVILAGTWGLLRDSVNLIIDAVPSEIDLEEVRSFLENVEGVEGIHDLHVWAMSTRENCLTAHLVMPDRPLWEIDDGYTRLSEELERRFKIHHVTLQVEKDVDCLTDCD